MNIRLKGKYLYYLNNKIKCAIGKKGITKNKQEGDLKTPSGIFKLKKIFYRKDRIKFFKSPLKIKSIKKNQINEINLNMDSLKHICNQTDCGDVRVNMGKAQTQWNKIPTTHNIDDTLHFNYDFQITPIKNVQDVCLVNIGNPHIIFFVNNLNKLNITEIGPKIENHEIFPVLRFIQKFWRKFFLPKLYHFRA